MKKPNFLILDEPTNDLDIQTLAVLEDYLMHFKGCVIIVSHYRYFMDRTVDHIWVFMGDGVVKDFPGNYSEYRAWKEAHDRQKAQEVNRETQNASKQLYRTRDTQLKLTYKEKRELEQLSVELEQLETEKTELEDLFSSGNTINDTHALAHRYEQVKGRIDELELRWLELSEKL